MESKASADDLTSLAASFPLLVYDHGGQLDNSQTLLSVADGSSHTHRVSELQNCRCLETPRGLVFIADTSSLQCSLWNPQTGEKIPLPALDKPLPEYCRCLLSDTISSPDCLPELLFCHVRGGSEWISQTYDVGLHIIPGSPEPPTKRYICNMAAVQGKFYFMEAPDEVGVFSFVQDPEPRLEMTSFPARSPDYSSGAPQDANLHYLLESSQELFLVSLFFPGCNFDRVEEVCVYRMDFSKQEWCEVIELGDRLIGRSFLVHIALRPRVQPGSMVSRWGVCTSRSIYSGTSTIFKYLISWKTLVSSSDQARTFRSPHGNPFGWFLHAHKPCR
ncbi:unnamed protein product [Urochloa decumbens]|uniref:KIB1-4 beta-propeller domain-containing protein n=1 Tax=Urochloa decumbens TaxID=240449 RepID=A0ABC8ZA88_9POAL